MRLLFLLLLAPLLFAACEDDEGGSTATDSFDRGALLAHLADNLIQPAYADLDGRLADLLTATEAFAGTDAEAAATPERLADVRTAFRAAYRSWQSLSPLVTVPGEELNLQFRLNTYPTDADRLEASLSGDTDLDLPSNFAIQGFPAIEYLLYVDEEKLFGAPVNPGDLGPLRRRGRLLKLVRTAGELVGAGRAEWGRSRDAFVANDGNSASASVDRFVNDFIFNYEKITRAGKVGIPAGVFSNTPLPDRAEAPYLADGASREFLRAALAATRAPFAGAPGRPDLTSYLDALNVTRDGEPLSARIRTQFDRIDAAVAALGPNLDETVRSDNAAMLAAYDEMQRLVVLLKVDMLQALGINVDFVDADGD